MQALLAAAISEEKVKIHLPSIGAHSTSKEETSKKAYYTRPHLTERYQLLSRIGRDGIDGTLHTCRPLRSAREAFTAAEPTESTIYAAKIQDPDLTLTEMNVLAVAGPHPNVICPVDAVRTDHSSALILPYMPFYDMLDLFGAQFQLKRYASGRFMSPLEGAVVGYQLLSALRHLHSHHVAHGDVKPDNILIKDVSAVSSHDVAFTIREREGLTVATKVESVGAGYAGVSAAAAAILLEQRAAHHHITSSSSTTTIQTTTSNQQAGAHLLPQIVLADFGKAKVMERGCRAGKYSGTAPYCPPETVKNTGTVDLAAADIWAAGITLAVEICGGLPIDSPDRGAGASKAQVRDAHMQIMHAVRRWTNPFVMSAPWTQVHHAIVTGAVPLSIEEALELRDQWMDFRRRYPRLHIRDVLRDAEPDAVDLIFRRMLAYKPEDRWSAEQCLEHPLFAGSLGSAVLRTAPLIPGDGPCEPLFTTDAFHFCAPFKGDLEVSTLSGHKRRKSPSPSPCEANETASKRTRSSDHAGDSFIAPNLL